jgi:hypothetical protein
MDVGKMPENIKTSFWFLFKTERFFCTYGPGPIKTSQNGFFMAMSCEITLINFFVAFVSDSLMFMGKPVALQECKKFYEFGLAFCFQFTPVHATISCPHFIGIQLI